MKFTKIIIPDEDKPYKNRIYKIVKHAEDNNGIYICRITQDDGVSKNIEVPEDMVIIRTYLKSKTPVKQITGKN